MTPMRDILEDARKLSRRLRSHDVALDRLIGSAEDNLKRIQSLKQYQEAQDQPNSVGSSKLRTQIVLDLQKVNHHIRELQQENMELRAALEDHQKATELIMSKYRQHLSHLVNSSKIDTSIVQAPLQGVRNIISIYLTHTLDQVVRHLLSSQ
uniref:FGFR1 oncogene partner 2 homolog n=1 Tax=Caligus rogercresseyi TaxID=217165 RepID=C1BMQ8_CALRO|nr:FGFR1 oncogene partner 2 homolog [Caligus rogercresseyi]